MANLLPLNTSYSPISKTVKKFKFPQQAVPDVSSTVLDKNPSASNLTKLSGFTNLQNQVAGDVVNSQYDSADPNATKKLSLADLGNLGMGQTSYNTNLNYNPPTNDPNAVQLGVPIGEAPDVAGSSAVPEGYTLKDGTIPPETARFANLSKYLGGGVIVKDAVDKNKIYLSTYNDTPTQKAIIRGNLPGSLAEIDHIVPLAYGGADVPSNKQILSWDDHLKKTTVQEIASRLKDGSNPEKRISQNEALNLILNYKEKDTDGISIQDQKGNYTPINQDQAWEIYQKWNQVPTVTASSYWDSFKNASSKNNVTNVVLDVAKGVIEGLSMGLIKMGETTYVNETDKMGTISDVARFGGNVAGMMTGFGWIKAGIKGVLGLGAKAASAFGATGTASKLTKASSLFKPIEAVYDTFWKTAKGGQYVLAGKQAASTILKVAAGDAVVMNIIGQLSESGLPSEERNRIERAFFDTANGLVMGAMPLNLKGSAGVAMGTAVISRMEGASVEDSLRNAVVFGALHGVASLKYGGGKNLDAAIKKQAVEDILSTRSSYLIRAGVKPKSYAEYTKLSPKERWAALDGENRIIKSEMAKMVASGEPLVGTEMVGKVGAKSEVSEAYLTKWYQSEIAKNDLGTKYLSGLIETKTVPLWEKQAEIDWKEYNSQNLTPSVPLKVSENIPTSMAKYLDINRDIIPGGVRKMEIPKVENHSLLREKIASVKDPEMKFQITGQAVEGSPNSIEANKALIRVIEQNAKEPGSVKIYFSDTPELSNIQSKRIDYTDAFPDKNVSVVAVHKDGTTEVIGHVPSEKRIGKVDFSDPNNPVVINGMPNSQNETAIKRGYKDQSQLLNASHNKDTITDIMRSNNAPVMEVRIAEIGYNKEGTPYILTRTDPVKLQEAIVRNFDIPESSAYFSQKRLSSIAGLEKQLTGKEIPKTNLEISEKEIVKNASKPIRELFENLNDPSVQAYIKNPVKYQEPVINSENSVQAIEKVDVNEVPVTLKVAPEVTLKASVSQNRLKNYIEETMEVLRTGDPKMVKSHFDTNVGKNVVTLNDASKMIKDVSELTIADFLPLNSKFDSVLGYGIKTGKLNDNGLLLQGDFKYTMENNPSLIKTFGDLRERSMVNNLPVSTKNPLKTSSEPDLGLEIRRAAKGNVPDEVRHANLSRKVSEKSKMASDELLASKKAEVPVSEVKPVVEAKNAETPTLNKATIASEKVNPFMAEGQSVETKPIVKSQVVETTPAVAKVESLAIKKGDFSRYGDKKGPLIAVEKIVKLSTTDKTPSAIRQELKKFNKEGMIERINTSLKKTGSKEFDKAFTSEFLPGLASDLKSITGKDVKFTSNDISDLRKHYNRLIQSHTRNAVLIDNKNNVVKLSKGDADLMGEADANTILFNRKNKLPEDAMEIITINKESDFRSDYGKKLSSDERINLINEKLSKIEIDGKTAEFIPIGKTAKGEGSLLAVKYSDEVAKMYDGPDAATLSNRDKFLKVYTEKVLGLPKGITADDLVKRSPLIFQRYEKYLGSTPNKEVTFHVLKSKPLTEAGGIDSTAFKNPESPEAQAAIKIYEGAKDMDGKIIFGEDLFDEIIKAFNLGNTKALKPIISGKIKLDSGDLAFMIQKGHIIKADPAYRAHIKEVYGKEFGRNEAITFDENVKIGQKEGTIKIPMKNFYMKDLSYTNESALGPSFLSKFSAEDGISKNLLSKTKSDLKNLDELTTLIAETGKNKEQITKALMDFAEKTGIDKSEFTYGFRDKIYENGAGSKRLRTDLQKMVKNLFFETVYKPKVSDSKLLFITPPIKLKLDGPNNPARYQKAGEIIVGKKYAEKAGVKDGDNVIVKREPSNHISDYVYGKAKIGDKMGATSLGDEHIMLSSHDTYIKVKGDYDGDAVAIFKIGDENMPESFAKAIKEKGQYVLPIKEATKREKLPLTSENINKVMKSQLVGDDQTSYIASTGRIVNILKDNDPIIKIYAGNKKESRYETIVNGKVVDSGVTSPVKETVTAKLSWGDKEDVLKQQTAQYALDSKGSDDIIRKTATPSYPDGGDPQFMLKNSFTVKNDKGVIINKDKTSLGDSYAKALTKTLEPYQSIFNMASDSSISNLDSLQGGKRPFSKAMEKSFKLAENIKEAGGTLHPIQENILLMKNVKDFIVNNTDIVIADSAGVNSVKSKLSISLSESSPEVKEIMTLAQKARKKYNSVYKDDSIPKDAKTKARDAIREEVVNKYNEMLETGKLTDKDVTDLAYWAATSPDSNIAHQQGQPLLYIRRYDEFIGEAPNVSRTYYEAYENAPESGV